MRLRGCNLYYNKIKERNKMKLNELNTKPMRFYNSIYTTDSYIDIGDGLPKNHLFQIMSAEDLNISHMTEIEKKVSGNFPFTIDDWPAKCTHVLSGPVQIELSKKIARVTFTVISTKVSDTNVKYKGVYTVYTYLYKNMWHVL